MKLEEKVFSLEGQVTSFSKLCSLLLATNDISDQVTNICINRV
jgi:hypothetical protein